MRVRGFFGGYYVDALAGVDIALWDLFGQARRPLDVPALSAAGATTRCPPTSPACPRRRCRSAATSPSNGSARASAAIKFAAAVSDEGIVAEMAALREAVGPDDRPHGRPALEVRGVRGDPADPPARAAQSLLRRGALRAGGPRGPGARRPRHRHAAGARRGVADGLRIPAALRGPRDGHHPARDGPHRHHRVHPHRHAWRRPSTCRIIPHASISIGIFMAASLQATAALQNVPYHEYQHSIFDRNLRFTTGDMALRRRPLHRADGPRPRRRARRTRSSNTSGRSDDAEARRRHLPGPLRLLGRRTTASTATRWPSRSSTASPPARTASPSSASSPRSTRWTSTSASRWSRWSAS